MTFGTILALIAALALVGVLPVWPWSRQFDNRPAIVVTTCLATILIFIAIGVL